MRRRILATETQSHGDEQAADPALDAAPHSGGPGGVRANERREHGTVVRSPVARLTPRPAGQADRVERLCASVPLWPNQIEYVIEIAEQCTKDLRISGCEGLRDDDATDTFDL